MEVRRAGPNHLDPDILTLATDALRRGEIICYPTETFYALGIDPENSDARQKLYLLKKRPAEKELPLIAADFDMVARICDVSHPAARMLAERFWPGPLTLVLHSCDHRNTFAIRISSNPVARQIARTFGSPIVSTSANLTGQPPVQDPANLAVELRSGTTLLIDCGKSPGGQPSSIVSLIGQTPHLLREGAISSREIYASL